MTAEKDIVKRLLAQPKSKLHDDAANEIIHLRAKIESHRIIDAALEYLESRTSWQPINTAPTDGTLVLGLLGNGEVFRVGFSNGGWLISSDIGYCNPLHWMPYIPLRSVAK